MATFRRCGLALVFLAVCCPGALSGAGVAVVVTQSPEEQYAQIDREYVAALDQYKASYEKATTDQERQKVYTDSYPDRAPYMARCMVLAKQHPHTTSAAKALVWILHSFRDDDVTHEALETLRTDYLDSELLALPCAFYGNFHLRAADALLRDLAAKSPHRSVRGTASISIARRAVDDPKGYPPEAEKLLAQAAAEYGDVKVWDRTVKEIAEGELLRMHAIGVGKPAPEIAGADADGHPFKLSDYRGKVVMLDFWGRW